MSILYKIVSFIHSSWTFSISLSKSKLLPFNYSYIKSLSISTSKGYVYLFCSYFANGLNLRFCGIFSSIGFGIEYINFIDVLKSLIDLFNVWLCQMLTSPYVFPLIKYGNVFIWIRHVIGCLFSDLRTVFLFNLLTFIPYASFLYSYPSSD